MNIKGESNIIDLKKDKLKKELAKSKDKQNLQKIRRLEESIKRHKSIAKGIKNKRKRSRRIHGRKNNR